MVEHAAVNRRVIGSRPIVPAEKIIRFVDPNANPKSLMGIVFKK